MARLAPRSRSSSSGRAWLALLGALVVLLAAGAWWLHRKTVEGETDTAGCLTNAPAPMAVLFMVDATDRLTADTAKYVIDTVRREEAELPRYSRVIIVPFGDDTAGPLKPLFTGCLPGKSGDAGLNENGRYLQEAREAFNRSLDTLQGDLTALAASKSSPIAEQVVRAASDPVIGWTGAKRRMVLVSDGLESSIYWSRELKLADPPARLLDGAQAEFVELGNAKGGRFQSDQMRQAWKSWFQKAGADARITAPGYAAAT